MRISSQNNRNHTEKGFTLLEIAFVITIFAIMSSIVLFRFKDFGSKAAFDNLSQDIALRIVQAQKAAISGALNPNFVSTSNPPTYGVAFQSITGDPTTDPATHEFTYFTDIPLSGSPLGNKRYDVPPGGCPSAPTVGNECLSITAITGGEYIAQIGYLGTDGLGYMVPASDTLVSISFTRPFPDATMTICNGSGTCSNAAAVYIVLASSLDVTLLNTIAVKSLGEVHVFNGSMCGASGIVGC